MVFPNYKNKHVEAALFSPSDYIVKRSVAAEVRRNLPKKYIIVYYPRILNYFRRKYKPKKLFVNGLVTVYKYKDVGVVRMTGIGSPNAAACLEELIALGGREFINTGSCGGLVGFGVFLCNKAIRDEGTSHHYIKPGKFAYPDKALTKRLAAHLKAKNIEYQSGATWTIDAPYRETKQEIRHYRKAGIKTVEMEASALFAVAKLRKAKIASVFAVSDTLGDTEWNPQFKHTHTKQKIKQIFEASLSCLLRK